MSLKRAEIHLTYDCDLKCYSCNRGCFSGIKHTPDMTIEQFTRFLDESRVLNMKYEYIVIIGGEPTLHPDCIDFIKLAKDYTNSSGGDVLLFSNNYSTHAKKVVEYVRSNNLGIVYEPTFKNRKVNHCEKDTDFSVFIDPNDIGKKRTGPCDCYTYCGFSVDALSYTACSLGGMIASLTVPTANIRAPNLSWLLDEKFVNWQLSTWLCEHCGTLLCKVEDVPLGELYDYYGTRMSKKWFDFFKEAERIYRKYE